MHRGPRQKEQILFLIVGLLVLAMSMAVIASNLQNYDGEADLSGRYYIDGPLEREIMESSSENNRNY